MVKAVNFGISSQDKLNRVYRLTVQSIDENDKPLNKALVIDSRESPLTMRFSINRSIWAEINGAEIELYNLKLQTQNELFYDYFNTSKRTVILEAGYEGQTLSVIFIGDMWSCYTSRQGTETITRIECIVGWKSLSTRTDQTLAGASRNQILKIAANDMALDLKIYSGEDTKFTRPVSISGNSFKTIQKYSGGNAFIDNNTIYVLNDSDTYEGYVPVINDSSGLLGVPEHEDAILKINMIFEPRIMIGQIIELKSRIGTPFNGQYKVYGIRHEGIISNSESGKATTTLEMLVGAQVYGRFYVKTPQQ